MLEGCAIRFYPPPIKDKLKWVNQSMQAATTEEPDAAPGLSAVHHVWGLLQSPAQQVLIRAQAGKYNNKTSLTHQQCGSGSVRIHYILLDPDPIYFAKSGSFPDPTYFARSADQSVANLFCDIRIIYCNLNCIQMRPLRSYGLKYWVWI